MYILFFFTLYFNTRSRTRARYYYYHHEITYTHAHTLVENVVLCSRNVLLNREAAGGNSTLSRPLIVPIRILALRPQH